MCQKIHFNFFLILFIFSLSFEGTFLSFFRRGFSCPCQPTFSLSYCSWRLSLRAGGLRQAVRSYELHPQRTCRTPWKQLTLRGRQGGRSTKGGVTAVTLAASLLKSECSIVKFACSVGCTGSVYAARQCFGVPATTAPSRSSANPADSLSKTE